MQTTEPVMQSTMSRTFPRASCKYRFCESKPLIQRISPSAQSVRVRVRPSTLPTLTPSLRGPSIRESRSSVFAIETLCLPQTGCSWVNIGDPLCALSLPPTFLSSMLCISPIRNRTHQHRKSFRCIYFPVHRPVLHLQLEVNGRGGFRARSAPPCSTPRRQVKGMIRGGGRGAGEGRTCMAASCISPSFLPPLSPHPGNCGGTREGDGVN